MYGKHFSSMYTGSMFGNPPIVFAVWGYIIANMAPDRKKGGTFVEINPQMLSAIFASPLADVHSALDVLESPDPNSRSPKEEGRRIININGKRVDGPMQYFVVNGDEYRALRDEEARRAYMREKKRIERESKKSNRSENVNHGQPPSTHTEKEIETKTETETENNNINPRNVGLLQGGEDGVDVDEIFSRLEAYGITRKRHEQAIALLVRDYGADEVLNSARMGGIAMKEAKRPVAYLHAILRNRSQPDAKNDPSESVRRVGDVTPAATVGDLEAMEAEFERMRETAKRYAESDPFPRGPAQDNERVEWWDRIKATGFDRDRYFYLTEQMELLAARREIEAREVSSE